MIQFACLSEWKTSVEAVKLMTEESAWTLTRSAETAVRTSHTSSTLVTTLVSTEALRSCGARRDFVANTVLPCLQSLIERAEQIVENSLLDSASAVEHRPTSYQSRTTNVCGSKPCI